MNLMLINQILGWIILVRVLLEMWNNCQEMLRIRRWWVKPHLKEHEREAFGAYTTLFKYFKLEDEEEFYKFVGMSINQFNVLLRLVEPRLIKHSIRKPLPPELRLAAVLNYLVHGDNVGNTACVFRIGRSTMYRIVPEVCEILCAVLKETCIQFPVNANDWKAIANQFYKLWNIPNCIGSIDGKHVRIKCPSNSGSQFWNYEHFYSIVLMGMCDAYKRFIWVNIGDFGCLNDAGIFQESDLGKSFEAGEINLPAPTALPGTNVICPYFIIGDSGFPLKSYLMRPFSRGMNVGDAEKVFNYRLSRARRIIECAFGTLTKEWKILQTPLDWKLQNIEIIIMAIICIHNFLITDELINMPENRRRYSNCNDYYNCGDGDQDEAENMYNNHVHVNNALAIRNALRDYFVSPEGSVPWQWNCAFRLR